jgi:cytochrome c oxidase subunit 2
MWDFPLFPIQASDFAEQVDHIYFGLLFICGTIALLVAFGVVAFSIRYRKDSKAPRPPRGVDPTHLETGLVAVLLLISLGIFAWASQVYVLVQPPTGDAWNIDVVAKQWMWKTQHPQGQREINSLHLPVGRRIRLTLRSEDVIHSFFVPAFRVKQDVLPGRYTHIAFTPTKTGVFHLFCAEYCGAQHSKMVGQVVVLEEREFQTWLEENRAAGGTSRRMVVEAFTGDRGKLFFEYKCHQCHMSDNNIRAPNLEGLFGKEVALVGGTSIVADEEYIRESIVNPAAKVVRGYPDVMPTFKGQISSEELAELVNYVKSLQFNPPQGEEEALGTELFEQATAEIRSTTDSSEGERTP